MKKTLTFVVLVLLAVPSLSLASIDYNLKYGQKNTEVSELQDFLVANKYMDQSTGFFGLLTLNAVKSFQVANNIPSTGYVGLLTRTEINKDLSLVTQSSTEAEIAETGTSTPSVCGQGTVFNTQTGARCTPDPLIAQVTQLQNQVTTLTQTIQNTQNTGGSAVAPVNNASISLGEEKCTVDTNRGTTTPYTFVPVNVSGNYDNGLIRYSISKTDSAGISWTKSSQPDIDHLGLINFDPGVYTYSLYLKDSNGGILSSSSGTTTITECNQ